MSFQSRLLLARREAGLTQADIAARLGVARESYARWENGKNAMSLNVEQWCSLSKVLGKNVGWLVAGEVGEMGPPPEPPPINTKMPESTPTHLQKGRSRKGLLYPSDFPAEQPGGSPVEQAMARIEAAQAELLAAQEALRQAIGRR